MFEARVGVLVIVGALLLGSCVNLSYPPGASRDGGSTFVAHRRNGAACTASGDCQSGFCIDSVCCMTSCEGPCSTCAKGAEGFCMFADVGTNLRGMCTDSGVSKCGQTGFCDGAGACQIYPAGTSCAAANCPVHLLMLASRCDGNGACVPGSQQSCSPYLCDTDAKCLTDCASDTDCENGHKCMNGLCGKKALGTACGDGTECDSTVCAQGVCCLGACAGGCRSCALPGSEGACTAVPAGMLPVAIEAAPPDGSAPDGSAPDAATPDGSAATGPAPSACTVSGASTCGADGTCDGAGGCRLYPAGTACSPATCASAMLRNAGTCDGKNHCQFPAAITCGGYTCGTATTCKTTCAADTDCASPSVCGLPQGACGGVTGQYFRQTNLTDLAFTRTDPNIDFNWMLGSPSPLLNVDNFAIRWTGKITSRFTEPYTFIALTDDGERLWINDKLIIDHFVRKASIPEDDSPAVMMTAGQAVDIKLEYFENGGDASAQLLWQSPSEARAVIPTSALAPQ